MKSQFVIWGEVNNLMSNNSSFPGEKIFSGEKPFSGGSHFQEETIVWGEAIFGEKPFSKKNHKSA